MSVRCLHRERVATPIGVLVLLSDDDGALRAVDWTNHEPRMLRLLASHYGAGAVEIRERDAASPSARAVERYFAGDLRAIDALPVATAGTPFQRRVWRELRTIPPGTTIIYGELARRIGQPFASRAVGLANGANPVSVVVPCHRVIGSDGSLTGYGGGIERKRWLLAHEGALPQTLELRSARVSAPHARQPLGPTPRE